MISLHIIEISLVGFFFALSILFSLSEFDSIRHIVKNSSIDMRDTSKYGLYSAVYMLLASGIVVFKFSFIKDHGIISFSLIVFYVLSSMCFSFMFAIFRAVIIWKGKKMNKIVMNLAFHKDLNTQFNIDSFVFAGSNILFFSYYELDLKTKIKIIKFKEVIFEAQNPSIEQIAIKISQEINKIDSENKLFENFIAGHYKPKK